MFVDKTIDHRLAWLAGIIDGEGTICLGYHRDSRRYPKYAFASHLVAVSNTDEAMIVEIRAIADVLGIKQVLCQTFERRRPTHKPQWRITFKTRGAVHALLAAIFPYLVTKRPQAELMLRAISYRRALGQPRRGDNGYRAISADPNFAAMVSESRHLNHRGIVPQEE